jgi:hypothetical protein|tara:strand:- start:405 stop:1151 length:747 start_codon:yes stop_codon:yes gene_type:complete
MSKNTKQPTTTEITSNPTQVALDQGNSDIVEMFINNFNFDEVEPESKRKRYSSAPSEVTDTGQDNPFWNVSLIVRLGGYVAKAEKSYQKAIGRADNIEKELENGKDWYADDTNGASIFQQNEANIENAELEMNLFRQIYEAVLDTPWEGAEKHEKHLDSIFNPATLGSMNSGSKMKNSASDAMLKIRARKSGRSLEQQKDFESRVDTAFKDYPQIGLDINICKISANKAEDMLRDAIKQASKPIKHKA